MEQKTKVNAEKDKQELVITREFDLPLELLFKAYSEAQLVEQWMGTKVLKMESKSHGSYQFQTTYEGKIVFQANGTIHKFIPNKKIVRTFEMNNSPFGVQLEILQFEKLSASTSKLTIHTIFESVTFRDQLLQMPFASGINMAHDRLQGIVYKLK